MADQAFAVLAVHGDGGVRVFPVIAPDRVAAAVAVRQVLHDEVMGGSDHGFDHGDHDTSSLHGFDADPSDESSPSSSQPDGRADLHPGVIVVLSEDELSQTLEHLRAHNAMAEAAS